MIPDTLPILGILAGLAALGSLALPAPVPLCAAARR